MIKPVFNVLIAKEEANYTEFVLEPLEQGFGNTVGNALRRVLLSSIQGHAVTSAKIKGVDHEFQTIKGVTEDVVEILLNLKEIRVQSDLSDAFHLTLSAQGGEIKAGDFTAPAGARIVNGDHHIATLEDKTKLEIELTVEQGLGYSPATDRTTSDVGGELLVDALYSPVTKVAYSVEQTRVGRRTDFDRLVLKMWTDGTIDAREALNQASEIMIAHFQQVVNPTDIVQKPAAPVAQPQNEAHRLTIEELELPTRIANALRKAGYQTVGDLSKVTKLQASMVKNLGGKSVDMVEEALVKAGGAFKPEGETA